VSDKPTAVASIGLDIDKYIQIIYNFCMSTKTFNLSLPVDLVNELDKRAKKDYSNRSEYIRRAVVNQMRSEEALEKLLDRTNEKGSKLGINSEQQVYEIIANKQQT